MSQHCIHSAAFLYEEEIFDPVVLAIWTVYLRYIGNKGYINKTKTLVSAREIMAERVLKRK